MSHTEDGKKKKGRPKGMMTKEQFPLPKGQKVKPGKCRDKYGRFLPGKKPFDNGRPREHEPSPEDIEQIERLSSAGHGIISIQKHLGIHSKTWKRWKEENPEIMEAYRRGLAAEEVQLVTELRRILTEKDNPIPGIFLLKSRHGYQDGGQQGTDSRVQIAVQIPAALPADQYDRAVDVTVNRPELPEGDQDNE